MPLLYEYWKNNEDESQGKEKTVIVLTAEDKKIYDNCTRSYSLVLFSVPCALASAGLGILMKRYIPKMNWPLGLGIAGFITSRMYVRMVCVTHMMDTLESSWPWDKTKKDYVVIDEQAFNAIKHLKHRKLGESSHKFSKYSEKAPAQTEDTPSLQFDEYKPMDSYESYSSFNNSSDISDSQEVDLTEIVTPKRSVSYSELRAKNRAQYAATEESAKTPRRSSPPAASAPQPPPVKTNEYGDVME